MPRKSVSFRGAFDASGIRTAQFDGREHTVIPVIALVEGVLFAANAESPELVLAEEFSKVPDGWNGRPVLWDHPILNGIRVSANEPLVLEKMGFGQVFHAKVDDRKLKVEAWLDSARVAKQTQAQRVLERIRSGEVVEVSVGAFVETEPKSGIRNGQKFSGIWRNIVPDHLAMLPEGTLGACSVEMGCGAPRAAQKGDRPLTLMEKFKALMEKLRAGEEAPVGDSDVRALLEQTLFGLHPAFLGVVEVFSESGQVVFATAPEGEVRFFRQSFEMVDGVPKMKDDPEEVRESRTFEPVTASTSAGCGCGKKVTNAEQGVRNPPAPAPAPTQEENVEKKVRVLALIAGLKTAAGKPVFEAADEAFLMALSDDRLKALEEKPVEKPAVEAPSTEPKAETTSAAKPQTEEEYLAAAPDSVKTIIAEHKARAASRRTELLTAMSAAKQTAYSEDELKTLSNDQLEKLVKLVGASAPAVDQSGRAFPRQQEDSTAGAPKPIDIQARILAKRKSA
jgi:uncharacterized protein DUF2213